MTHRISSQLRLCRSEALAQYLFDSYVSCELGNAGFARYVQAGGCAPGWSPFKEPWVLFHSWHDGFIELDEHGVSAAATLITEGPSTREAQVLATGLARLGWLEPRAADLSAIAHRTHTTFIAMQNLVELHELLDRVQRTCPQVILEIGTARGGLLYALAQIAPPKASLISLDLPGGTNGGGPSARDCEVFASFAKPSQSLCCIIGDSHTDVALHAVQDTLEGNALDLLIIDGDHTYEGVRSDLVRYGALVAPTGLIALHDIRVHSRDWGAQGAVGDLWAELENYFDNDPLITIVDPSGVSTPRRPRHRPWAWGFGLLTGQQASAWSAGRVQ